MRTEIEPIAVVGVGCLLPGAPNCDAFYELLKRGQPLFKSLPRDRWKNRDMFFSNEKNEVALESDLAAFVSDQFLQGATLGEPRLNQMVELAARECLSHLGEQYSFPKKTAVILGCMSQEERASDEYFSAKIPQIKIYLKDRFQTPEKDTELLDQFYQPTDGQPESLKHFFPNSLARTVHETLGTNGPAYTIDAACASSLAAIDLSVQQLLLREVDFAVTGGAEGSLGPETFLPFSKLGLLSKGGCRPFDRNSDGVVQGEGVVLFFLQRLHDALMQKNPIQALILHIESGSNDPSASLFAPSVDTQLRIIQATNEKVGVRGLVYIEGHGTGTPRGDAAELEALGKAFEAMEKKVCLGSVKSIIGHTKGASGAAGLLKCILALRHKQIFPSSSFKTPQDGFNSSNLRINTALEDLKDKEELIQMRVSSFGFGGSNYHLSLSNHTLGFASEKPKISFASNKRVGVMSIGEVFLENIQAQDHQKKWGIPPQLLSKLDLLQVGALAATDQALERGCLNPEDLNLDKTIVIATSMTSTVQAEKLSEFLGLRRCLFDFKLENTAKNLCEKMAKYLEDLICIDESIAQIIPSMISGRVALEKKIKGINFHLDAQLSSFSYGLKAASTFLKKEKVQTVIVLRVLETLEKDPRLVSRSGVQAWILMLSEVAGLKKLSPIYELSEIEIQNG